MPLYKRKIIKRTPIEYNSVLMEGLLKAYQLGYPLSVTLDTAGIEFPEMFHTNGLEVSYDITFGGAEQLSMHNGRDCILIVRRTGLIMLTFTNPTAVQQYIGRGRFKISTDANTLKTMWIDSKTLEPQFK